ncbi:Metallophosphoesterase domain protein [Cordyceps fumosorosea ARSEF 2679]|uniref:Metallophosphoesterase domain protein n=1 Tax=Cordyceps fumosorosea (strain ARSEF 2679) TaxID=1081104 RepID=A0A167P959_CORFA|nr:Metallophosphoesterase domain protein [Cordyceps fumosorosea ARSEF 2679]OAA56416.1 Metallophosphoesterase domain protein [Cordyceps fumosorosea ARSEF 2679]
MADTAKTQSQKTRQQCWAERLIESHRANTHLPPEKPKEFPIRVVCISDTRGTCDRYPEVPDGDLLIHAGNLTELGSFEAIQEEIHWLDELPHKYKVVVAGNLDRFLDDEYLKDHPDPKYRHAKTKADMDWSKVYYLEDGKPITLRFSKPGLGHDSKDQQGSSRTLRIFGSPWTPNRGGKFAFQYDPSDAEFLKTKFSSVEAGQVDIVVTHGPPKYHQDGTGDDHAGCPHLAAEIGRVRPRLHVFGHIPTGYGCERILYDKPQSEFEKMKAAGSAEWRDVLRLAKSAVKPSVASLLGLSRGDDTFFVNAAVSDGPKSDLREPIVVEL